MKESVFPARETDYVVLYIIQLSEKHSKRSSYMLVSKMDLICRLTVMRIIKLKIFPVPVPVRLHSGSGKLIFVIISPCVALFKNVVHSLEPGETPSYSASHQAPNYAQRS